MYPVIRYGGIQLWDSLEFVTWERRENSTKIKHANNITETSLTDYIYERTFSMPFLFHLCHDNDCLSLLNCATRPNHRLSDINFKNHELVCYSLTISIIKFIYHSSSMNYDHTCEIKLFFHTSPFLIHMNEEGNLDIKTFQNPAKIGIKTLAPLKSCLSLFSLSYITNSRECYNCIPHILYVLKTGNAMNNVFFSVFD